MSIQYGSVKLLHALVEGDVKREGPTSSTMVRAGFLLNILEDYLRLTASVDTGPKGEDAERLSSSGGAVGEAETPNLPPSPSSRNERETIVSWLRNTAASYPNDIRKSCLLSKADAIERGEHLTPPDSGEEG
jgi:hypothetical protein